MRIRTAAVSAGIAVLTITGVGAPAQAASPQTGAAVASSWMYVDSYSMETYCIDSGQQYEREGWNAYYCDDKGAWPTAYRLFIR